MLECVRKLKVQNTKHEIQRRRKNKNNTPEASILGVDTARFKIQVNSQPYQRLSPTA